MLCSSELPEERRRHRSKLDAFKPTILRPFCARDACGTCGASPFCSESWSVGRSPRLILRGRGLGSDHPRDDQSAIYRYSMKIELLAFPELEIVG